MEGFARWMLFDTLIRTRACWFLSIMATVSYKRPFREAGLLARIGQDGSDWDTVTN